ncbi:putative CheY-like superfamily protein [Helianthus anomalus]
MWYNLVKIQLKLHMEFFLLQMSNQHMRVLAVDDNPTCLKLLEGLLRKCQYQGDGLPISALRGYRSGSGNCL